MLANLWAGGGTHVGQHVGTLLVIFKWYMLPKGNIKYQCIQKSSNTSAFQGIVQDTVGSMGCYMGL